MSNFTHFEYKAGLSQVGQYQMSGVPYALSDIAVNNNAGAVVTVDFPTVTRFFTVVNTSAVVGEKLRVGFSSHGVKGTVTKNYFVLDIGQSYTAEMKVSQVFLLGDTAASTKATVIAGLTGIATGSLQNNWSGSIGVG